MIAIRQRNSASAAQSHLEPLKDSRPGPEADPPDQGASGGYGYPSLTEKAKVLEDAAKAGDTEAGVLALQQIDDLCRGILRGRAATAGKEAQP